ncbi:Solitary outer membrane autotransporter beta-barrel domain [Vibrio maritimus]|uniref:Solitary outer membrane autotransporter beta-barrel domain n=1 Tax=Vibrio maritimus TaxID=990268 RepID=UPI003734E333
MHFVGNLNVATCLLVFTWFEGVTASPLSDEVADILAQRFSAAVLLTDSEAIEFGVGSFNPNDIVNTNNENLGSDQALAERKNKSLYLLPYKRTVDSSSSKGAHILSLRAYSLRTKSEFSLFDDSGAKDVLDEAILGWAVGYGYRYKWNENFSVTSKINNHFMHYSNQFSANSIQSESIEVFFDGSLFNTSAWSTIVEPSVRFEYDVPVAWGDWALASTWSYFRGYAWGHANQGHISEPMGWYVTNQLTWSRDYFDGSSTPFIGLKRVDLSKDLQSELSTNHYYEMSVGWLFNNPVDLDWVENVGVGINLNYGSSLRGGSISLYYNK